ncbi:MAG: 30S ribosomal protein S21 [Bacteroidia bacterium]
MIVIEPQEGENLEKMLRRYKRKFDKLNIAKEVRFRMFYVSKAAQRRETIKRAQWRQKVLSENI